MLNHYPYELCKIMASNDANYMVITMMSQVKKHLDFIQEVAAFTGCLPKVYLHLCPKTDKKPGLLLTTNFKPSKSLHVTDTMFGKLPSI